MYKTIYTEVEVDVDLGVFDTDDLLDELENRGESIGEYGDTKEVLTKIYEKHILGLEYQAELSKLIWLALGKMI